MKNKLDIDEVNVRNLNKINIGEPGELGLGYTHIAIEAENAKFMKAGIPALNVFAGEYEGGMIVGRNEFLGKDAVAYTKNDTVEYITEKFGFENVTENLYETYKSMSQLLTDEDFEKVLSKAAGETAWLSLALYGAAMVVLESLRDDGHMLMIFLRVGQVVAALLPIIAIVLLSRRYHKAAGKATGKAIFGWVAIVLLVAGIVVLEFALDGRLAMGELTNGHFYLMMTLLCVLVATACCLLYGGLLKERAKASANLPQ